MARLVDERIDVGRSGDPHLCIPTEHIQMARHQALTDRSISSNMQIRCAANMDMQDLLIQMLRIVALVEKVHVEIREMIQQYVDMIDTCYEFRNNFAIHLYNITNGKCDVPFDSPNKPRLTPEQCAQCQCFRIKDIVGIFNKHYDTLKDRKFKDLDDREKYRFILFTNQMQFTIEQLKFIVDGQIVGTACLDSFIDKVSIHKSDAMLALGKEILCFQQMCGAIDALFIAAVQPYRTALYDCQIKYDHIMTHAYL